jgi:hypothetical protein
LVWGLPHSKHQNVLNSPSRPSSELAARRRGSDHVGPAPGNTNPRQTDVSAQAAIVTSPTTVQHQLQQAMDQPAPAGEGVHLPCCACFPASHSTLSTSCFCPLLQERPLPAHTWSVCASQILPWWTMQPLHLIPPS